MMLFILKQEVILIIENFIKNNILVKIMAMKCNLRFNGRDFSGKEREIKSFSEKK